SALVDGHVVNAHRTARGGLARRSDAPASAVRIGAAYRNVKDDREAVINRSTPDARGQLSLGDPEVLMAIQVPRDRFAAGLAAIDDHAVSVQLALAARAWQ